MSPFCSSCLLEELFKLLPAHCILPHGFRGFVACLQNGFSDFRWEERRILERYKPFMRLKYNLSCRIMGHRECILKCIALQCFTRKTSKKRILATYFTEIYTDIIFCLASADKWGKTVAGWSKLSRTSKIHRLEENTSTCPLQVLCWSLHQEQ